MRVVKDLKKVAKLVSSYQLSKILIVAGIVKIHSEILFVTLNSNSIILMASQLTCQKI